MRAALGKPLVTSKRRRRLKQFLDPGFNFATNLPVSTIFVFNFNAQMAENRWQQVQILPFSVNVYKTLSRKSRLIALLTRS